MHTYIYVHIYIYIYIYIYLYPGAWADQRNRPGVYPVKPQRAGV